MIWGYTTLDTKCLIKNRNINMSAIYSMLNIVCKQETWFNLRYTYPALSRTTIAMFTVYPYCIRACHCIPGQSQTSHVCLSPNNPIIYIYIIYMYIIYYIYYIIYIYIYITYIIYIYIYILYTYTWVISPFGVAQLSPQKNGKDFRLVVCPKYETLGTIILGFFSISPWNPSWNPSWNP